MTLHCLVRRITIGQTGPISIIWSKHSHLWNGHISYDLQKIKHDRDLISTQKQSLNRCGVIYLSRKCYEMHWDLPTPPTWWCLHRLQEVNPWGDRSWIYNKWFLHKFGAKCFKIDRFLCTTHRAFPLNAKNWCPPSNMVGSCNGHGECKIALESYLSTTLERLWQSLVDTMKRLLWLCWRSMDEHVMHGLIIGVCQEWGSWARKSQLHASFLPFARRTL